MENHKHNITADGYCKICAEHGIKSIPIDMSKISMSCHKPTKEENFERAKSLFQGSTLTADNFESFDIIHTVDLNKREQGFKITYKLLSGKPEKN